MNFITQQQGDCKVQFGEPGHKKKVTISRAGVTDAKK